eukprot:5139862-Alexandrium_andersonii.AAC.1
MPWTDQQIHLCAVACYTMIGGIFLRCIKPFLVWPWRAALLVHEEVPVAEKTQVARELARVRACCCDQGFTLPLVDKFPGDAALLSPEAL